jgi:hypothetical protein
MQRTIWWGTQPKRWGVLFTKHCALHDTAVQHLLQVLLTVVPSVTLLLQQAASVPEACLRSWLRL